MRRRELASLIDHTLLLPDAGPEDIERLCTEAAEYGFASACVNSLWVPLAYRCLCEAGPIVCSVVGFPLGASNCVEEETARAVENGADEIDVVLPAGYLKWGESRRTLEYLRSVVKAASDAPVKVILETCILTDLEKVLACRISIDSGASWVKTSTGFGSGGATVADVSLMLEVVRGKLGVKASGGIRTLSDALDMINAGAGRLGCSRSVSIVNSLDL